MLYLEVVPIDELCDFPSVFLRIAQRSLAENKPKSARQLYGNSFLSPQGGLSLPIETLFQWVPARLPEDKSTDGRECSERQVDFFLQYIVEMPIVNVLCMVKMSKLIHWSAWPKGPSVGFTV